METGMDTRSGLRAGEAQVPLLGVAVEAEVYGGHARVKVRQRYVNGEAKPVEAVYTFPLPTEAALTGFAMTCGGRRVEGVVKEREAAFHEYADAISAGHGAALLEQERPNVFTASVGNLLPGEETLIEVEYVERVHADEGALRWSIPTLVAPRYIPGAPDPRRARTADGAADPTDRVPDADRITPRIGDARYGLTLDVVFELSGSLRVESPSHALSVTTEDGKVHARFAQAHVALDRDVVLMARGADDRALTSAVAHRRAGEAGTLALTVVPELFEGTRRQGLDRVVFLIDVSGSMDGDSLREAKSALRLCLRQLREGARFNVIAFQSTFRTFQREAVPFTQRTLDEADRWVEALRADGGTEMLQPLLRGVQDAGDGLVVLLTDGQVGNEDEILKQVLAARRGARVYSIGIGTNVSDVLLRGLARETGGAVESIFPGERIDEKVVAQFARALAPRVTGVSVRFHDLEVGELAPGEPPPLVDGEPWTLFGRLESGTSGHAELRGTLDGQPFVLEVPIDVPAECDRPALPRLWATERIRDLESHALQGRRADALRDRVVALATTHGVSSKYTAFVVVETRAGDRRASGEPETRVVPVNAPAGWAMFQRPEESVRYQTMALAMAPSMMRAGAMPAGAPLPAPPAARQAPGTKAKGSLLGRMFSLRRRTVLEEEDYTAYAAPEVQESRGPADPVVAILGHQLASGLWLGGGQSDDVKATVRALLALLGLGVTSSHALYGAQVKKAVDALVALAPSLAPASAELGLGAAWLAGTGHRTRKAVEAAIDAHAAALRPLLGDEAALRARIDAALTA